MDRRRLLAACGTGLAGLAGCTSALPGGDTTAPEAVLAVERTRVLPYLVARTTPDSADVVGDRSERYVLVTVDATEAATPPAREAFTLSAGGTDYDPQTDVGYGQRLTQFHRASERPVYGPDDPRGELPFVVDPPETATEVTLAWRDVEVTLDGAGEALARPATSFAVESFEATSEQRQRVTLTATVRNAGDARGWFVGAVNRRGPAIAVAPVTGAAVDVAAGARTTWTYTDDSLGDTGTARYTLRTADEERAATAEVG